jgi:hypothetical protein
MGATTSSAQWRVQWDPRASAKPPYNFEVFSFEMTSCAEAP